MGGENSTDKQVSNHASGRRYFYMKKMIKEISDKISAFVLHNSDKLNAFSNLNLLQRFGATRYPVKLDQSFGDIKSIIRWIDIGRKNLKCSIEKCTNMVDMVEKSDDTDEFKLYCNSHSKYCNHSSNRESINIDSDLKIYKSMLINIEKLLVVVQERLDLKDWKISQENMIADDKEIK